jgi:hypothetical protein
MKKLVLALAASSILGTAIPAKAYVFADLVELQSKLGRDPSERGPARIPQFLQNNQVYG